MAQDIQFDVIEEEVKANDYSNQWVFIPTKGLTDNARQQAIRLNAFGSLYYFAKVVLRKHRFTPTLHKMICDNLERDYLKELLEIPRDHFKSTIASESTPIWWALPFEDKDEAIMRKLGYGDEWIRWMRRAHNQNTRTLIVSETIKNAAKLGRRISLQYENNHLFRALFPEILPDKSCPWSEYSMVHRRGRLATAQGEGTYDFLGVGGALQSRHYDRVVQDDLVGRDALKSLKVMDDTVEYHKLLVGAFDSDPTRPGSDNDEIIIGNRWAYNDLNSYIRQHEKRFRVTSHSALGGCCNDHPRGIPIFPEEWTEGKLAEMHQRLKTYLFSCQYLNSPTLPGQTKFKEEWLRYYSFETVSKDDLRIKIIHEVKDGEVKKDIMPIALNILMIVDPNHKESEGRCNHAVTVVGILDKPRHFYLLDCWADSTSYDALVDKIYDFAIKWKLKEVHVEDIAAQILLRYPIATRGQTLVSLGKIKRELKVTPMKVDKSKDAKRSRIEALENIFDGTDGTFWIRRIGHEAFTTEYLQYPHGATRDTLDTIGYVPTITKTGNTNDEVRAFLRKQENNFLGTTRNSVTGY